jgi:hypothetical protein
MSNAYRASFAIIALLAAGTGYAAPATYISDLTGPAESPPNASPATGTTTVAYTASSHMLQVDVTFSGLLGTTTASHIHCCTAVAGTSTAGVATQTPTFSGFPLGVTAGTYSQAFDLTMTSSFNPSFVTANGGTAAGAEAALVAGMANGKAYLNIHSSFATGGEIRGFLLPRSIFVDDFEGP